MRSAFSADFFSKELNETQSIVEYYQLLIPKYLDDCIIIYKKNQKKGKFLKYTNILLLTIIFLFMVMLALFYL